MHFASLRNDCTRFETMELGENGLNSGGSCSVVACTALGIACLRPEALYSLLGHACRVELSCALRIVPNGATYSREQGELACQGCSSTTNSPFKIQASIHTLSTTPSLQSQSHDLKHFQSQPKSTPQSQPPQSMGSPRYSHRKQ